VHRSPFSKCCIAALRHSKILTLVALCLVNPGKLVLMAARDIMANTSEPDRIKTRQSEYFSTVVALLPELVCMLLLIFSVAPTFAATYAGPSAQAADLWTTQA
jgi:ABC-type arginine transport system permease subunit